MRVKVEGQKLCHSSHDRPYAEENYMARILYIAHRVPYPPNKGERLRAYHQIKALAAHHEVIVAALAHHKQDLTAAAGLRGLTAQVFVAPAGGTRGRIRGALCLLRGRSATEGYFQSPDLLGRIQHAARGKEFDLAIGYSSGVLPTLLAAPAKARVMDLIDVDSAKWADYARAACLRAPLYRLESRRVAALEQLALERCERILLTSPQEAALLPTCRNRHKVLPVGNGVDTDFFRSDAVGGGDGKTIVFTGTMDYLPNVDGVCRFAKEVWHKLRAAKSDVHFIIVGRDPTAAVRRLAKEPGITVTGSVDNVRPYLQRSSVAVVPLNIARGIQNKVLEAMAAGVPVIASPCALDGLEVTIGKEVLCAASSEQWVMHIESLLGNPARRYELASAARRRIETRYTWRAKLAPMLALVDSLASKEKKGSDIFFSPSKCVREEAVHIAAEKGS